MSCWVAPAVAAELWRCSVEDVLAAARDGHIPSRVEGQFLLVQMAFPGIQKSPPPVPPARPRVNEEILTPQEMAALTGSLLAEESLSVRDTDLPDQQDAEQEAAEVSDGQRLDMSQWRTARQQTSNLRRPPVRAAV